MHNCIQMYIFMNIINPEYLRQELLASLVGLQFVNVLHKDSLILEHVTLRPQVEAVVPGAKSKKEVINK